MNSRRRSFSILRPRSLRAAVRGTYVRIGHGRSTVHFDPVFLLDFQTRSVLGPVDGLFAGCGGTVSAGHRWE
jgi:hypothetical protein